MKPNTLTEGNIFKTLLLFAIPFLIANILQSFYGAVDLFVVGKYCPAEGVAAVSTGTQITQIISSLISGLTLGSTILVGQYMGRRDLKRVKQVIGTTLTAFAAVSLILTVLMLVLRRPLLSALNTPSESFGFTLQYITICTAGTVFICGYNAISAILRGYGDSTRPMLFVGVACVLNIILDFVFVKYFEMGVAGTAWATIISQAFSMITAILYLKRKQFIFDFKLPSFRPVRSVLKELALVGIPISLQELCVRISFLYLTTVMNRCGVYAAAVVGVSGKYDMFAMLTASSMANALTAITAQNIGAGKPERARKSLWYGISFAFLVSCVFWFWAQVNPQSMIRVFTNDAGVVAAGVPFFRSCSYDYLLVAFVFCLNGYLNGRQKTIWTMVSCTSGALVLRIPIVFFFGKYFADDLGKLGMAAAIVSAIMAAYTLVYVLYEGQKKNL